MSDVGGASKRPHQTLEPSSSADLQAAIEGLDLAQLRWAVRSLPLSEVLTSHGVVVASTDLQTKTNLGRFGEALADEGRLDAGVARRFEPLVLSMLLAALDGPRALFASYLIEDAELPLDLVAMVASAPVDPEVKTQALCRLLADLDTELKMDRLSVLLGCPPDQYVNETLLAARPQTVAGCERHMRLIAEQLDRTRWTPDRESFLDLLEAWSEVTKTTQPHLADVEYPTVVLLRGMARTWEKQRHWRAAGIASLAQLILAPDAEALGRAIFEASTLADWPLLEQVIDAAVWVEDHIEPAEAEAFLQSVMPTVGRLRARGDDRRADAVVALSEACAQATIGTLSEVSLELLEEMRRASGTPPSMYGLRDLIARDSVYQATWGFSFFGSESHDTKPRSPAADVLRVASDKGITRRHGPLCLILVADLAIEFGDLALARNIVEQLSQVYPAHSTVLFAQGKLAAHTSDDLRSDELLDKIARLWSSDGDEAGADAQMEVLEQLHDSRGQRLVEMRAQQLSQDSRFVRFSDRLKQIQR